MATEVQTKRVYSPNGEQPFNELIETELAAVAHVLKKHTPNGALRALVLGGGYGRGEGGAYNKNGKQTPYNDYDMFFILSDKCPHGKNTIAESIRKTKEEAEHLVSVDVDISRPYTKTEIENEANTLMFYELINGHKVILGDKNVFDEMAGKGAAVIRPTEFIRLLMNRYVGLLLSKNKNTSDEDYKHFVPRNIHKAYLALGDVYLFALGEYSISYREKLSKIKRTTFPLQIEYECAVNYRFAPNENNDISTSEMLSKTFYDFERLWQEIISELFGTYINTYEKYKSIVLQHEQTSSPIKSAVQNTIRCPLSSIGDGMFFHHPRIWLYVTLPKLFKDRPYSELNEHSQALEKKFIKLWEHAN